MHNYEEPENAEEIIHDQVREIKKEFKERGIQEKDIVFVFMDEGSFQNHDNSQRVWYFDDKNIIEKNLSKERANTIIYYSPNGESHVEFLEKSIKEPITWSLFNFKKNKGKTVVMILDNLSSHHSIYFTTNANFYNIWLIFNAPYTPRLNPAETPIKEIRRYLSPHLLENVDKIKGKVLEGFDEFIKCTTCAEKWIYQNWTLIN